VPDIHEQEAPSGELKKVGFEGLSGFFLAKPLILKENTPISLLKE